MITKGIVRWLVGLLLGLASLFTFIFLTQPGLKFTASIAKRFIPGKLSYQRIEGTLIGPIDIKGLHYQNKQDDIKIKYLSFNYAPLKLFSGLLDITQLKVDSAYIKIKPSQDKKKKSSFALPFKVAIAQSTFKNITINNKKTIHIQTLYLSGRLTSKASTIKLRTQLQKPYPIKLRLLVNGTPNHYTFILQTWAQHLNAILKGEGDLERIHFTTQEAHILNGSLNADATVHFKTPLSWNIKLHANKLNLSLLNSKWPSPLSINLVSQGQLVKDKPHLSVDANIQSPSIQGTIKANNIKGLQANWDLLITQASKLIPHAKGRLKTTGHLSGTLQHPIIKGRVQADYFSYKNVYVGTLNAEGRIDSSQKTTSDIKLQAKNLIVNNNRIATISVTGKGTLKQHQLHIKLNSADTDYTLQLQGAYAQQAWQGTLQAFNIKGYRWGQWSLVRHVSMDLSAQQIKFSDLCLAGNQKGELCLQGFWHQQQPWQLSLRGARIPPSILTALLHTQLKIQSKMQINAVMKGQGKQLKSGTIQVKLAPGRILFSGFGKPLTRRLLRSELNATITSSGLRSQFNLQLDKKDSIKANLNLPQFNQAYFSSQQKINGRLDITLNSLRWLTSLTPGVELPKGALYAHINLGGSISKPDLSGKANFKNAQINVPRLGLQLKQTKLAIQARGKILHYTINAKSNGGSVIITGKTDLGEKHFRTILSINMKNALIYNTNEYKVYATAPVLSVKIDNKNLTIEGIVNIPKATLEPKRFENIKTLPEHEVVFIGKPPTPFQKAWIIKSHVFVSLGKQVMVDTKGVQGYLTGSLLVTNTKQEQMIASGSIYIHKGKFTAYGTDLTFSKDSAAIYRNSPIGNPNLNVTASKQIKVASNGFSQLSQTGNITVGIHVSGTLKSPVVKLFSTPANLSQADILSYLVLGYASVSGRASDVGLLLRAVNAFNLTSGKGGEGLVSQLQQGLGLSELGIETQSTLDALGQPLGERQTSFVVGKQISPYLYLRYSLGLNNVPGIDAGSMVELRFSLSRHWMIQTNAGKVDTGVDIFYMIDK